MAQVAFSIRMDEGLKKDFSRFCDEIGMSMSTAFVMFAKKSLEEYRIPFTVGRGRYTQVGDTAEYDWRRDPVARRAKEAFDAIRADVKARNLPEMSMDEIDAEIALARKERRERRAREAAAKEAVSV